MKVTYLQRTPACPVKTEVAGYRFIAGAETEVDRADIVEMLSRNPWFRVEGARLIGEGEMDPKPVLILPTADHVNEETSDAGVTVKDDDFSMSRDEMIEELRERGIKVDGRWSDARLASVYQDASEKSEDEE